MEPNKKIEKNGIDLFDRFSDEINPAYERAVREALKKHKLAGNPVVIERDGEMVILQPDEIEIN